eukprot:6207678-Pleurochrysis_carterae.AAC.1
MPPLPLFDCRSARVAEPVAQVRRAADAPALAPEVGRVLSARAAIFFATLRDVPDVHGDTPSSSVKKGVRLSPPNLPGAAGSYCLLPSEPRRSQRVVCAQRVCAHRAHQAHASQRHRHNFVTRKRVFNGYHVHEGPLVALTRRPGLHPLDGAPGDVAPGIEFVVLRRAKLAAA